MTDNNKRPAAFSAAVIAAGLDEEYQGRVMESITKAARAAGLNLSVFSAFGGVLRNLQYDAGEYSIYSLFEPEQFDGVLLMTNTVSDPECRAVILEKIHGAGIPAVVLDSSEAFAQCNVRIDNADAMRQIVEHVLTVHGAKTVNFISGPLANPEAKTRYEVFLQVMREHGMEPEEGRIFFGEFRPVDGADAVLKMLSSELPLPDALICANDAMALDAIEVLESHGISVPDDMIVTGFDNTYFAQHHCPAVTTVSRSLNEAGTAAVDALMKLMRGEECPQEIMLKAEPIFTESCGCPTAELRDMREFRKSSYHWLKRTRSDVSLLNRMTSELSNAETAEEMVQTLSCFVGGLNCEQFCLCLCEDWQSAFREGESRGGRTAPAFTDIMSAPLIFDHGGISQVHDFPRSVLHPAPPEGSGNISYYFPLHFREKPLGYAIVTNGDFPVQSMLCHSIMMSIGHSLENIRKLLHLNSAVRELDRLYVTDPLCGIYNRNGFIRLADVMFRQCIRTGAPLMIAFIDMDGLKIINDNYGHDEGDFALRRLAEVIHDVCGEKYVCARFGGDEFIIVGGDCSEEEAAALEKRFAEQLADANRKTGKPYELGASIGSFVTQVEPDMKLFTLISRADQIMYEQKKKKSTSRYLRKN